ncbi:MFS transporter [Acinetobacter gerneri]|uniref:MFS transporter n=1 Tax=Acinetobacter gerneri TaxID=202952 RepID=A0AAW8JP84_9GAMM|nr:MFS transporter [Acinetobacter gerneri]MDQ9011601.1 MFS transporter [Acinetobacter gerneri]MDQ9015735.1 MFS transporter [Acinetobacter gerneri]MDQ9026906.1 MFS transporter [Acinetobacter gerneri]MDQ9054189.1 MFS transporter [Acinetobacter gerneri]MDQ9061874.1 MFS transporter [Acinetobacter gerneri]
MQQGMQVNQKVVATGTISIFAVITLLSGLIPQGLSEAAISPALPEMAKNLGKYGDFAAQMLMGMCALGLLIGSLVSGKILEKLGAKKTHIIFLILFGVFGSFGLFLQNGFILYASRIIVGFSAACIATVALWAINHSIQINKKPKFFGATGATAGIAILVSIIYGGFVTQHFGWQKAFSIYPLFAILALPFVIKGAINIKPEFVSGSTNKYFSKLLPSYLIVIIFYGLVGMGSMQLPFLLNNNGVTEAGFRSIIQGLPSLIAIIGAGSFGFLHASLSKKTIFPLCLVLLACGFLCFTLINHGVIFAAIGACIIGFSMGLSGPYFYHTIAENTDLASSGRYLGYLNAFTFLGVFINPMIFQPLKSLLGQNGIFILGIVICLIISIMSISLPFKKSQKTNA